MHHLEISRDNVELSYQDTKSHKNDRLAMVQIEKINLHNNGINKKNKLDIFSPNRVWGHSHPVTYERIIRKCEIAPFAILQVISDLLTQAKSRRHRYDAELHD